MLTEVVIFELELSTGSVITQDTIEWFFPSVYSQVSFHVRHTLEDFLTEFTYIFSGGIGWITFLEKSRENGESKGPSYLW